MIIEAIALVVRRDGPLPVRAIQDRLWGLRIRISTEEVLGALTSNQGKGIFASYPKPTRGNHATRMHYYLKQGV
jgi:hypothetical protein